MQKDQNRQFNKFLSMIKKTEKKNLVLLDYYDNPPLGIIYDWIRSLKPEDTIILKHLSYVPYCKKGNYSLLQDGFLKKISKKIRIKLLLIFLRYKGYEVINFDKEFAKKFIQKDHKNFLPEKLKEEIIRDFVCQKDKQFSFFDIRIKHIYKTFNNSIDNSYFKYFEILKNILNSYNSKRAFIFNGRALRQKVISHILRENKLKLIYIERNTWNLGRTVSSEERIHSFNYLSQNKCKNYGLSTHDINVDELYKNRMIKNWGQMHTEKFHLKDNKKRIISYLSGSSDEYLAFTREVMLEDCSSQFKLVKFLSNFCLNNNYEFILRVHPNTRNKSLLDIDLWNELGEYLLEREQKFYSSKSNINTYSIIQNSDLIVTNGSTVTVESCLEGKNVCLCGFNGLRDYESAFIPKDLENLKEYILSENFINKEKIIKGAKKYLLDELQAGRILKYYSMKKNRFYF